MSYDEPHAGNTLIEFQPYDSSFCMEDNIFLPQAFGSYDTHENDTIINEDEKQLDKNSDTLSLSKSKTACGADIPAQSTTSDNASHKDTYRRITSVVSDEYNNNCVTSAPLKISGQGLVALYANNTQVVANNTIQKNIFVSFDPNEGEMKLYFTREGLNALDKLNSDKEL